MDQLSLLPDVKPEPPDGPRLYWRNGQTIRGTINRSKPCNDSCYYAIGCECSCSCGGKMHGVGRQVLAEQAKRFKTA